MNRAILFIAAVALAGAGILVNQYRANQAASSERARVIATISANPIVCRDSKKPFYLTVRNLAERTVLSATINLQQVDPQPLNFALGNPKVDLAEPLPPGQDVSACYALNRMQLIAWGHDPARVQFSAMPDNVVFE